MRQKGRYFSVRFSALVLERLEEVRVQRFGKRTTLAETIRRLVEDGLHQLSSDARHIDEACRPIYPQAAPPTYLEIISSTAVDALLSTYGKDITPQPLCVSLPVLRLLSRELIRLGVNIEQLIDPEAIEDLSASVREVQDSRLNTKDDATA